MTILSQAREFFQTEGRDIDKARFAFHFDGGSLAEMLVVLARYQNDDGGFFGLEVDIAAPASNPFATELALIACLWADVPRDHPLLKKTVAYLEQTQEGDDGWRFTETIYQHDLAPWFQGWEWPNLNPTCTLAGTLKALGLGSDRLHAAAAALFERLAQPEDMLQDNFYGVRPYAYYFLPDWVHPQRELYLAGLLWWLIRQHANDTSEDGNHFFDYIRSPQTYPGRMLPERILNNRLDRLAAEQQANGGWPTPYNAGWRDWVTVQNLLTLRAFGRI